MAIRRVLTGVRTTGPLHLGHYVGALKQWKQIQDDSFYHCFFLLADIQALTTHQDQPELLSRSVREVVLDWLSVGLDPTRLDVDFVLQSQIPERAELSILLSMLADYRKVLRNPTLKSELKGRGKVTLGFINYPVDQIADIYMVSPAEWASDNEILVPVGEDQVPHLEDARDLAQDFNRQYGRLFNPCRALVGEVGRLVGTDGDKKMSKSMRNTIELSDTPEIVRRKVMSMFTDPKRVHATDKVSTTRYNPVFIYLRTFNPDNQEVEHMAKQYREGRIGDVAVKSRLAEVLNTLLDPFRERRAMLANVNITEILDKGTQSTRAIAGPLLEEVKDRMHLTSPR